MSCCQSQVEVVAEGEKSRTRSPGLSSRRDLYRGIIMRLAALLSLLNLSSVHARPPAQNVLGMQDPEPAPRGEQAMTRVSR